MNEALPDHIFNGSAVTTDASLPNVQLDRLWTLQKGMKDFGVSLDRPMRFLVLYGSIRKQSYSRYLAEEAMRLLIAMGAEVKTFDPRELPTPADGTDSHPRVRDLQDLSHWADGHVWVSPELHGLMSSVLKLQLEHLPLMAEDMQPTRGRTLAVMQVSGGSQSFNCLNQMRVLGRWLHMISVPYHCSLPEVSDKFDGNGRMKPGAKYDRVVDVLEQLVKFTLLLQGRTDLLLDYYSERVIKV
ncbi:MAG: NAD(P)H-dependent oxidoreductase [Methyloligellaceae bacterium]